MLVVQINCFTLACTARAAMLAAAASLLVVGPAVAQRNPVVANTAPSAQTPPASTALADAARAGNRTLLTELLPRTADVNAFGSDGTPALHWLVRTDDLESVQQLLNAGANANAASRYDVRPLYLAATNGSEAMIRLLVSAGADPNAVDAMGENMLMAAVSSGDRAAVAALIEFGADVNARDSHYAQTALMVAARAGFTGIAQTLINAGAEVDAQTRIAEEPKWILPNSRPGFSFGIGIIRGGLPADRGMRPFRPGGMTALLYAARHGHTTTAELLLDSGADINASEANQITPLLMAISNNQMTLATLLIERGAALDTPDWYGRTPLWSAVNVRNLYLHNDKFENYIERAPVLEVIRLLLKAGANPNPRTTESPPVREHLLSITGTLEWVDFTGQTPFLTAALAGDVTVMRLLLEHGADAHLSTFGGTTPLMAAAGINWVVSQTYTQGPESLLEAVKLCVELGMDVNAVNSMGLTAVFGAANRGSNDIIEFLVSKGARLDIADNEGRTPLDWARGVFLATHPAEPKPHSIALIEQLMAR
jgi:ankyrin repeat protein